MKRQNPFPVPIVAAMVALMLLQHHVAASVSAFTIDPGAENVDYFRATPQVAPGGHISIGFFFRTNSTLEVTGLGVWDPDGSLAGSTGPGSTHQIAIFDDFSEVVVGAMLGSPSSMAPVVSQDDFLYATITPTVLMPGVYTVAAFFPASPAFSATPVADYAFFDLPEFSDAIDFPSPISAPGVTGPIDLGTSSSFFSPNFLFTVIPEPSSGGLIGFAALCILMIRKRRV